MCILQFFSTLINMSSSQPSTLNALSSQASMPVDPENENNEETKSDAFDESFENSTTNDSEFSDSMDAENSMSLNSISQTSTSSSTESKTPIRSKRRALAIKSNKLLVDFIKNIKPPAEKDNKDLFFNAITATMRSFPPVSVAKLKLKIGQLVYGEGVALAEKNSQMQADMKSTPISLVEITSTDASATTAIARIDPTRSANKHQLSLNPTGSTGNIDSNFGNLGKT